MPSARSLGLAVLLVTAGAAAIAVAARVSVPIPGSPVPQSLQTLAVCLAGAWLGPRRGPAAVVVYLAAGAAGLPVFADGAAGWRHLIGPTAGYLAGFAGAAWLVGRWAGRKLAVLFVVMLAAHAVILGLGWLRLGALTGWEESLRVGVAPFLWGGVVKAGVGAVLGSIRPGRQRRSDQ